MHAARERKQHEISYYLMLNILVNLDTVIILIIIIIIIITNLQLIINFPLVIYKK